MKTQEQLVFGAYQISDELIILIPPELGIKGESLGHKPAKTKNLLGPDQ